MRYTRILKVKKDVVTVVTVFQTYYAGIFIFNFKLHRLVLTK